MNKKNIYFLYKKNELFERNPSHEDILTPQYIAIEQHSDNLTIIYKWVSRNHTWENIDEVYEIGLARGRWKEYIEKGYVRVTDPYPSIRVGNGVTEERKIVTINPRKLSTKITSAKKSIRKAYKVTKEKSK